MTGTLDLQLLIVDDDPFSRGMAGGILKKAGYYVKEAENARQAWIEIGLKDFDLFVLDVVMPDVSGYELCSQLRKNPKTARTPIILLTSLDNLENKLKGFEAGAWSCRRSGVDRCA